MSEPTVVTKMGGKGHCILLVATCVPPIEDRSERSHVSVTTDGKSLRSQLLILDGDCKVDGPVTNVDLPHHVNYALHPLFVNWYLME